MADSDLAPAPGGVDCDELNAAVAALQEELALERAKNEVLMEQVLSSEDALADNDVAAYGDVIPNEDREYWRGQLIENRTATVNMLNRTRELNARAAAPAAEAAAPAGAPKPLHNRETAKAPAAPAAGGQIPADRASKLRNRAQEIARAERCSFTNAFRRAEQELTV